MRTVELYAAVRRAVFVEGLSQREAARRFGLSRTTVAKMMQFSVPPGYRRSQAPRRPKLEPFLGVIDRILEQDIHSPRKQRHTAWRLFERLREEYGFDGGYTIVKDYVRDKRLRGQEMFVPLSHPPGQPGRLWRSRKSHCRGRAAKGALSGRGSAAQRRCVRHGVSR